MAERIELTQCLLGMKPYVLIEADTDPDDGELVLAVKVGGGAQEQPGALPMLMLTTLAADQNPLMEAVSLALADHPEDRAALARFAEVVGFEMPAEQGVTDSNAYASDSSDA